MAVWKSIERGAKRLVPVAWRKYFRASRYEVLMQRMAPVELIVHVGGHLGEDAALYEEYGAATVLWIEADPDTYAKLCEKLAARSGRTRHLTECALVSATEGTAMSFHRFSGDGASSSIHRASDLLFERFPLTAETGEVLQMRSRSLPQILAHHGMDVMAARPAMLVLDVQGHELSVLQGLGADLRAFAMCKCEVSRVEIYQGGAVFNDIDAHFRRHGFRLASHRYALVPKHGDVLYVLDAD